MMGVKISALVSHHVIHADNDNRIANTRKEVRRGIFATGLPEDIYVDGLRSLAWMSVVKDRTPPKFGSQPLGKMGMSGPTIA
jgi:hypothetical protein